MTALNNQHGTITV